MDSIVKRQWDWGENEIHMNFVAKELAKLAKYHTMFRKATSEEDLKKSSDMIMITDKGEFGIGIRFRQAKYKYRDLTIRAELNSGAKTEYQKLKDGMCDVYFYGWETINGTDYAVIDIRKMRSGGILDKPDGTRENIGSSYTTNTRFHYWSIKTLMDNDCVIHYSG